MSDGICASHQSPCASTPFLLRLWPEQLFESLFVITENDLVAANNHWASDKVRRFGHELDSFRSCRWLLAHVFRSEEFVPLIQKLLIVASADQAIEFGFAQGFLVQVARIQFGAMLEQETSCFAAGRSSWFLKKLQLNFGHVRHSVARHLRIDFHRPALDAARH